MRIQSLSFLLALFLVIPLCHYGQKSDGDAMPVKVVPFMVRNGDNIKNIAPRIKLSVHEILKANRIRSGNYVAYPGRILLLPIHTQPKVWDPTREDMTGNSPSREDRRINDDYDIYIDSSNYALDEDFISVDEIRGDSIEFENMEEHIRRVDRRISYLYYKLDSAKQADFNFESDDGDKNTVLGKMQMTKEKYFLEGPLGKAIDSLRIEKTWLGQRRIILRNKITEYEYLSDNASYSARHFVPEDREKNATWGDHLAYDTKYQRRSANAYQNQAVAPASSDTVKPAGGTAQTPPVAAKEMPLTVNASAPSVTGSISQSAPLSPATAIQIDMADLGPPDNGTDESEMARPTHYRSDFSLLPKQKFRSEINLAPVSFGMDRLPVAGPQISMEITANPAPASNTAVAAATVPKTVTPAPAEKATAAPVAVEKPVAEKVSPPVMKDTVKKVQGQIFTYDSIHHTFIAVPVAATPKPEETKTDSVVVPPVVKAGAAPVVTANLDPAPAVQKVQVKDIPAGDSKGKPNYLKPVDSSDIVKGDFYFIRARQTLEKGDVKNGEKYLRKSLDLDPHNASAWMLHADLSLTQGQTDQALKEYLISGEIDSTNPKVFYNIALLYNKANDTQKAFSYFTRSIQASDKYIMAYMGRASLEMAAQNYTGAISDYDRVVAVNKFYSAAFKARGMARMEAGQFAAAVVDFDQYLSMEDPDGYVVYERGLSKIYSNSLLQGCLDLSSALQLGYKDADKAIKKLCQ